MINRTKMPRQLRDKGGIASVTPRKKYGLGSKLKERFRKLVPNELADIAVKAAPFVAPFNPGIAGLMRGIGRFDQRGSISDAFKQGVGTFAFGAGVRTLGGATDPFGGGLRGGFTSPLSPDRTTAVKDFFNPRKESTFDTLKEDETFADRIATEATGGTKKIAKDVGLGSIRDATGLFKDVPILKDLPSLVQQQILVGGVTSAATYIYQAFLADEPPQEEGETYDEYMARRKENVGRKMRSYFDNYFKFDKDYSAMTDEQKQAFIDRVNVRDGGRIGYQTGGVTMANTLAENIRRNIANQATINQRLEQARAKLPTGITRTKSGYTTNKPTIDPTGMLPQISTLNPDLEQAIKNARAAGAGEEYIDVMLKERQDDQAIDHFKNLIPAEPPKKVIPVDPGPGGIDRLLPDLYEKVVGPAPEQPSTPPRVVTKPVDIVDLYEKAVSPAEPPPLIDDLIKLPVEPGS